MLSMSHANMRRRKETKGRGSKVLYLLNGRLARLLKLNCQQKIIRGAGGQSGGGGFQLHLVIVLLAQQEGWGRLFRTT